MSKPKRKKRQKDPIVRLRLGPKDLAKWKASAKLNGLNLSEFIRRSVNKRPLKAQKLPYERPEPAAIEAQELEQEREREQRERINKQNARLDELRELEKAARPLAKAAGGVERWFALLSEADREKYADIKRELLAMEELERAGVLDWRPATGIPARQQSVIPHDSEAQRIADVRRSIEEDQRRTEALTGIIL